MAGSKPFLDVSKSFLFVKCSFLMVLLFVIVVAVMGHRTRQLHKQTCFSKFCIKLAASMLESKVQLAPLTKCVIMAVLTPQLVIELTAFTVFETGRKLNSACCNYVHFSQQPLFL